MTRTTRLCLLATISACAIAALTARTPQGLFSDAAYQIDALQEYMDGHAKTFNETVKPLASDLSKDQSGWIFWWPPGTQLMVYPFAKAGLPLGYALRLVILLCLLSGAIGWARWIALFEIPPAMQTALVLLLPWMRYANNALFYYSAEVLAFATAPWALLGARWMSLRWRDSPRLRTGVLALFFAFGVAMGFRYILKYSGIFLSLGAITFIAFEWGGWRASSAAKLRVAMALLGCAIPVASLNFLNHRYAAAANGVVSTAGLHPNFKALIAVIANPALALADADSPLRYLWLHPARGWYPHEGILLLLGFPGGLLLAWLIFRRRAQNDRERLARWVLAATLGSLAAVWTFSTMASFEARHAASASLMLLPYAIQEGWFVWRTSKRRWTRIGVALAGAIYVALPLLYGVVSVAAKFNRVPKDYNLGPYKIYTPDLASHDLWGTRRRLLADFDPDHDVWYLSDPISAVTLPGRTIVRQADFMSMNQLLAERFVTSKPMRVRALIPPSFEKNGKGKVIRGSFPQAGPWIHRTIEGCNYVLWESTLNADSDKR